MSAYLDYILYYIDWFITRPIYPMSTAIFFMLLLIINRITKKKKRKIKKVEEPDPVYTYYGDKDPTMEQRIATLIKDDRFVGISRESGTTFKITVRTWSGVSMSNISYTETLERVMNWVANELERKQ